jgi:hypothetical protein
VTRTMATQRLMTSHVTQTTATNKTLTQHNCF